MRLTIPLKQMSVEDKLQAIEEIWTDLAGMPEDIPSPSWHADVLRAREQRISEGKSHFLDIADAKNAVRDRLK
ncbi:addiction module protein [Candidatus Sumerlaeota bacterium]|nr:addiction module protein [Candidatus Sumerlaeota bacterium]